MKNHTIMLLLFLLLLSLTGCGRAESTSPVVNTSPTSVSSTSPAFNLTPFTPVSPPPSVDSPALIEGKGFGDLETITLENAARLAPLAIVGEGVFGGEIAISPDGSWLIVAASGGVILFDAGSGERVSLLSIPGKVGLAHLRGVENLAFSPDGSRVAQVYRFTTGEIVENNFTGGEDPVFEPMLTVHQVAKQEVLFTKRLAETGCADSIAWNVAYSPDGKILAVRGISGMYENDTGTPSAYTICLLSAVDGSLIRSIALELSISNQIPLLFTPDGQRILAAINGAQGESSRVQAYELASGQMVQVYEGWVGEIHDMALSPDGEWLALSGRQGAQVLSLSDGSTIIELSRIGDGFQSLAFSLDGQTLALGSWGGQVSLWQMPEKTLLWETTPITLTNLMSGGELAGVSDLIFSHDGTRLFAVLNSSTLYTAGLVQVIQVADGLEVTRIGGRSSLVTPRLSPDASLVLFGGYEDGQVQLWSVAGNQMVGVLKGHTGMVMDAAFSPDGSQIATASLDGTVRLWRTTDGSQEYTLSGHTGAVWLVQYSPDGSLLASVGDDATLHLWNPSDGSLLKSLPTQTGDWWANTLTFAIDGKSVFLASGCEWIGSCPAGGTGDLRRIVLESGQIETILDYPIHEITFSANQTMIGIASGQGKQTGELLSQQFKGFVSSKGTGALAGAGLSPDGMLFFSGNAFGLHIWNATSGELIAILSGIHLIGSTAVAPDQHLIIIGDQDFGLAYLCGIPIEQ